MRYKLLSDHNGTNLDVVEDLNTPQIEKVDTQNRELNDTINNLI